MGDLTLLHGFKFCLSKGFTLHLHTVTRRQCKSFHPFSIDFRVPLEVGTKKKGMCIIFQMVSVDGYVCCTSAALASRLAANKTSNVTSAKLQLGHDCTLTQILSFG